MHICIYIYLHTPIHVYIHAYMFISQVVLLRLHTCAKRAPTTSRPPPASSSEPARPSPTCGFSTLLSSRPWPRRAPQLPLITAPVLAKHTALSTQNFVLLKDGGSTRNTGNRMISYSSLDEWNAQSKWSTIICHRPVSKMEQKGVLL